MLSPGRFASITYELPDGPSHVVALLGEHDLTTASVFSAYLADPGPAVVDVSGVELIDSTSLELLARATRRRGRAPVVQLARGGPVRRLFELLGLAGAFRCTESRRHALELAGGPVPPELAGTVACPCGARYTFELADGRCELRPDGRKQAGWKGDGSCPRCGERLRPLVEPV